jgi:hypothetical protein
MLSLCSNVESNGLLKVLKGITKKIPRLSLPSKLGGLLSRNAQRFAPFVQECDEKVV